MKYWRLVEESFDFIARVSFHRLDPATLYYADWKTNAPGLISSYPPLLFNEEEGMQSTN